MKRNFYVVKEHIKELIAVNASEYLLNLCSIKTLTRLSSLTFEETNLDVESCHLTPEAPLEPPVRFKQSMIKSLHKTTTI